MKKYAEAAPIAINFTVDVDQGITVKPKSLTIQQGEHNARYFQVSLVHNEMPVNLANSEVHFLTQPYKSNEIPTTTNCKIYDAESGMVMVAIRDYMTNKSGIINGEFVRIGEDGSALPFKNFSISVDGSIFVNDGLAQSEPLHSLVSALARVQRVEEYLEQEFMDVEAKYAGELSKTNAQLSEVANKGTTVEVLERVTKEEIDRQISDGTIASLTIMDDGVKNNHIANKAVSGEKTDFQFLDNLINISKQTSVGKTYSLTTNGTEVGSEPLSEVIDVEPGEYFGYLEMTVTNIENYVGGYIGLRFIHTIALDCYESFAGANAQLFKEGKIFLYGHFSVDSPGQVKSIIRCYNTTANYSFDFKVEKLYLFKDVVSDNEIEVLKKFDYSRVVSFFREKSIKNFMIDDKSILPNHLSESVYNKIFNTNKKTNIIDCWGDSLMAGTGGNGVTMPSELQKLLGDQYIVNNYGQGGEKAEEIAFRQGGLLAYAEPFTLKSDGSYTDIKVTSVDGLNFNNLNLQGTYFGNDKVDIDGVSCFFRKSENDGFHKVAIAEGIPENKVFNKKQLLIPESYYTLNEHIMIICIGQNGWISNNPSHLCGIIKNMIKKNNYNKYLVISRPTGDLESMANEEVEFATTFGNNYFNAREYLSKYGLLDNNLTPTQQDIEAMNKGAIPPQLLVDNVHGNENFYKSYAIGVNEKLKLILGTIG